MKVKKLIEILERCDPKAEVLLSRDAEGNGYLPLADYWECSHKNVDGDIEVGYASVDQLPKDCGYTEEDVLENGKPAVVLWPQ